MSRCWSKIRKWRGGISAIGVNVLRQSLVHLIFNLHRIIKPSTDRTVEEIITFESFIYKTLPGNAYQDTALRIDGKTKGFASFFISVSFPCWSGKQGENKRGRAPVMLKLGMRVKVLSILSGESMLVLLDVV